MHVVVLYKHRLRNLSFESAQCRFASPHLLAVQHVFDYDDDIASLHHPITSLLSAQITTLLAVGCCLCRRRDCPCPSNSVVFDSSTFIVDIGRLPLLSPSRFVVSSTSTLVVTISISLSDLGVAPPLCATAPRHRSARHCRVLSIAVDLYHCAPSSSAHHSCAPSPSQKSPLQFFLIRSAFTGVCSACTGEDLEGSCFSGN
ncbi:hypothetical protein U1Q18_014463 [Sarracenia purpurea var. burkii]